MPRSTPSVSDRFDSAKQDYRAARQSRFRPVRKGVPHLGAGADYHFRAEHDYLRVMEDARDMCRNDIVVGSMLDRSVQNWLQDGFVPDPETPDEGINAELLARWHEWAADPDNCDIAGEHTFCDYENMAALAMLRDGDAFVFHLEEGQLEFVEAHRCRSPSSAKARAARQIVHGVELDRRRRRVRYWFTKDELDPDKQTQIKLGDLTRRAARDDDGNPVVLQVYNPKRATQTRGVTALAPIFDAVGMHDDLEFAKLVQAQVVSVFALIESGSDWSDPEPGTFGKEATETLADGTTRTLSSIGPGMHIKLKDGHTMEAFSPNVPNSEFFNHVRLILQLIGINVGMPLVMLLMDASETNFSGFRGALEQAKLGFRCNQKALARRFHRPTWNWRARIAADEDPRLAAALEQMGPRYFAHKWNFPTWPYIEPLKDAQADLLQTRNALNSPRRIQAARGRDWQQVANEIVTDNGLAIELAVKEAERINANLPRDQQIHWREILSLPTPDGVQLALMQDPGTESDGGRRRSEGGETTGDNQNRST